MGGVDISLFSDLAEERRYVAQVLSVLQAIVMGLMLLNMIIAAMWIAYDAMSVVRHYGVPYS